MRIKSTQYISREDAITRIIYIAGLLASKNYLEIEGTTFEHNYDLKKFVNSYVNEDISSINLWTDNMIEDIMDQPFFRYSMFDNYLIETGEDE